MKLEKKIKKGLNGKKIAPVVETQIKRVDEMRFLLKGVKTSLSEEVLQSRSGKK